MSGKRRILMFIFFVLTIIDFYNCTLPGQEFSQFIRPIQMLVLLFWVLPKTTQFTASHLLIIIALLIASISDYVFYRYGSTHENSTILLVILKKSFFLGVLYLSVRSTLLPSKKLYRWAFRYVIVLVIICFLMNGFENWFAYIIAIQSGIILLFISLKKNNSILFNQLFFGYALIILSLIFGKILITDSRWFVEIIARFAYIFGHLLFISGLANIKLLAKESNISEYKIVE